MNPQPKVLVAMSGGVDSSVAACLLQEQGYDVMGVFMRLGVHEPAQDEDACAADARSLNLPIQRPEADRPDKHRGCCSAADAADARAVAGRLGIPFYALNFQADFADLINYFADEYAAARTPNPCVLCNQRLKFGKLIAYADAVGADLVATGHYAIIDMHAGEPRLRRAAYRDKDQSYVLFGMPPEIMRRTLFPLGAMTKDEVREHARRFGLTLHDKPESQDICFVPDGDYARVVRERRPDAFRPGSIRHIDGRELGRHEGIGNFTIGQRRGIGVAAGSPIYVAELNAETATVIVAPKDDLYARTAVADNAIWHGEPPQQPMRAFVKIRYNHEAAPATVEASSDGARIHVEFDKPQLAVTPGQALVVYEGDIVLGGGWISKPAD